MRLTERAAAMADFFFLHCAENEFPSKPEVQENFNVHLDVVRRECAELCEQLARERGSVAQQFAAMECARRIRERL